MVNEQIAVSNILNSYYVTIADTTGNTDSIISHIHDLVTFFQNTIIATVYVISKTTYVTTEKRLVLLLPKRCTKG